METIASDGNALDVMVVMSVVLLDGINHYLSPTLSPIPHEAFINLALVCTQSVVSTPQTHIYMIYRVR